MESAIVSWQDTREELGKLVEVVSAEVERVEDDSYRATVTAEFEKRTLIFVLTAEEVSDGMDGTDVKLVPTELTFTPSYTMQEKLAKAGMNTLMGMGTVFVVLIFISILIGQLKHVNALEKAMNDRKAN